MKIVILLLIFTVIAFTPNVWAIGGPIIAFNFDSAKNGVVEDVTGGGHNGVLKEGATIVTTKKFGAGALKIDGGNQTMEVATFAKLETYTDNTYAFWINFTSPASGGWDQILVHPAAPDSDRSPGLWVTPEGLSIHYRYNPGNLGFWGITQTGDQDAKFFEQNVWYHIVGVTSKALLTGFVNGKKVAEKAVPEKFAQGAREGMAGLYVGKSKSYGGPAAKFIIDDLAIYDRALTASEVIALMDGLTPVNTIDKLTSTWGSIKR